MSDASYYKLVKNLTSLIIYRLVFRVPTTHDVITALFNPLQPKSHIDLVNLALLGLQLVIFFAFPQSFTRPFFFLYFAFWRAAYDAGLGWVLTKQSKKKWIVREVQRRGWLDAERRPKVREWIKNELSMKMDADYNFDVSFVGLKPARHRAADTLPPSRPRRTGPSTGVQHLALIPSTCRCHPHQVRG